MTTASRVLRWIVGCMCSGCLASCAPGNSDAVHPNRTDDRDSLALRQLGTAIGLPIGTAFDGWQFDHTQWRDVTISEFELATISWGLEWAIVDTPTGAFDYSTFERQVDFAEASGLRIRGHALLFPQAYPAWLGDDTLSTEWLSMRLRDRVIEPMKRYRGRVDQWVVVNEPHIAPYRPNDALHDRFGLAYIDSAFHYARLADPTAELILNDTGNHTADSPTTLQTTEILEGLVAAGLVDAVGLQMHIDGKAPPDPSDVIHTMRSYGLPVYVTEFDVDLRDVVGSAEERLDRQAAIYSQMIGACIESLVCRGFSVWGINDKYSWLEWPPGSSGTSVHADATLYDEMLTPKPAYFAMHRRLAEASTN